MSAAEKTISRSATEKYPPAEEGFFEDDSRTSLNFRRGEIQGVPIKTRKISGPRIKSIKDVIGRGFFLRALPVRR